MQSRCLYITNVPCPPEELRRSISHDWLGSNLLNYSADYIAEIYAGLDQDTESRREFESYLKGKEQDQLNVSKGPGALYFQYLDSLNALVENLVEGYSPCHLVAAGPLSALPLKVQEKIKQSVHAAYLRTSIDGESTIDDLRNVLKVATDDLEYAIRRFKAAWFSQPPTKAEVIETEFETVRTKALVVLSELARLPRGIVLP